MKYIFAFLFISTAITASAQTRSTQKIVGGVCEGCEALFDYGWLKLLSTDTLPDFREKGPRLYLSGTIYQNDGKTPAANIILYVYHTNQEGLYVADQHAKGWEKRHGSIRGWIQTGADGKYSFYTLLPASYPNSDNPKHIHPVIKEPGLSPYWIDEFLFEGDPLLTDKQRSHSENRGGSGIIKLTKDKNGMLIGKRDIILGKNIPGY